MQADEVKKRVGDAMRARRNELEISQERAAMLCHLARSYYAEVETGKRNPTTTNLRKIAQGLELTAAELLERAGL